MDGTVAIMKRLLIICMAVCLLSGSTIGCSPKAPSTTLKPEMTEEELSMAAAKETPYMSVFGGYVGKRVEGNLKNWVYSSYEGNPLILDSIRQRDIKNLGEVVEFWYGMFAPGLLRGSAYSYRIDRDEKLKDIVDDYVGQLWACWNEYGHLTYLPSEEEMTVGDPGALQMMMSGLIEWYQATGSERALKLAEELADRFYRMAEEKGISSTIPILPISQLYAITGDLRHKELMDRFETAWNWTGNFLNAGLAGSEYFELPTRRWDHAFEVEALGKLYRARQDDKYLEAMDQLWTSITKLERRSTGGFTTQETAIGSPYGEGSSETCANIAWTSLTVEYAKLFKSSYAIDELEMSFLNVILGAQGVAGRWWTYDTPQEGYRLAAIDELVWQSEPGSPEYSCCAANCALGIGLLHDWGTFRDDKGIYLNYYGESEFLTTTPGGSAIVLSQQTDYPYGGTVRVVLNMQKDETFDLNLRIPSWSEKSTVRINGKKMESPNKGVYYGINRKWKNGDTIELTLDMDLHYWAAGDKLAGNVSLYRGPLLMAIDSRFNGKWDGSRPEIDVLNMNEKASVSSVFPQPMVLLTVKDSYGDELVLCDFATAGQSGTYYTTWFKTDQLQMPEFIKGECIWNQRPQ